MRKMFSIATSFLAVALFIPSVVSAESNVNQHTIVAPADFIMESEPNDTIERANTLSADNRLGTISSLSDVDFYRIRLGSLWTNKNITVKLQNIPDGRDYDLIVYDSTGTKVLGKSSNQGNTDESITFLGEVSKEYYVKVYSVSGYSTNAYYSLVRIDG